jgi:Ca-activated chloride channel family protein
MMSAWWSDLGVAIAEFRFLRPWWLLALLAIPPLLWWLRDWRQRRNPWRGIVDAHLLPHLLRDAATAPRWRVAIGPVSVAVAAALAVLALAGPSWRSAPQPLWEDRRPLVIAVDLSTAIAAEDVAPSRLLQARAKIAEILRRRGGGQIALVAYADDAYTVSPLTGDAGNIALYLDALSPEVMPDDGSRADRAIDEASRLLERAGFRTGDILLVTDHPGGGATGEAIDARRAGYRLSILGLGTREGGQYRDAAGKSRVARLQDGELRALAMAGGGTYAAFTPDAADLRALDVFRADLIDGNAARGGVGRASLDDGYWLLPPLLLLALFAFRRGVLVVLLLALLPWRPVDAAELWRREDQREHAAMTRGVEAYRAGDYAAAAKAWRDLPGAEAAYNRGNALAMQGRYDEAIAEYERALVLQPGLADAAENRRRVVAVRQAQAQREQARREQAQRDRSQSSQSSSSQSAQSLREAGEALVRERQAQGRDRSKPPSDASSDDAQDAGRRDRNASGASATQTRPLAARPAIELTPGQGAAQNGTPPKSPPKDAREAGAQPRDARDRPVATLGQARAGDPPPPSGDPQARAGEQRAADAALRARMRQAQSANAAAGATNDAVRTPWSTGNRERQLANDAWLRRVPDEPGGLLRAKFLLEKKRRRREGDR